MGKSIRQTDDGLPVFSMDTGIATDDGLPILKKKSNGTPVSNNGGIITDSQSQLPLPSQSNDFLSRISRGEVVGAAPIAQKSFLDQDLDKVTSFTPNRRIGDDRTQQRTTPVIDDVSLIAGNVKGGQGVDAIEESKKAIKSNSVALKEYRQKRIAEINADAQKLQSSKYTEGPFGVAKVVSSAQENVIDASIQSINDYKQKLKESISQEANKVIPKEVFQEKGTYDLQEIGLRKLRTVGDTEVDDDVKVLSTSLADINPKGDTDWGKLGDLLSPGASKKDLEQQANDLDLSKQKIQYKLYTEGANAVANYFASIAKKAEPIVLPKLQTISDLMKRRDAADDTGVKLTYQKEIERIAGDDEVKAYLQANEQIGKYADEARTAADKFPQVKRQQLRQQLNDKFFEIIDSRNDKRNFLNPLTPLRLAAGAIFGESPDENDIKQLAKETGKTEDEVKDIVKNAGSGGFFANKQEGVRISGGLTGIAQGVDETIGNSVMGVRRFAGVDNAEAKNRVLSDKIEAYKAGAEKNQLAKNGNYNINPYSIFNTMGSGIGQTAVFAAPALGASAIAGRIGSAIGTIAAGYAGSYEGAYKEAARYTTDENLRRSYANVTAFENALPELILSPAEIAGKLAIGGRKGGEAAFRTFAKETVENGIEKTVAQRIGTAAKEFANVVGAENLEEQITNITNNVSKQKQLGVETSPSEWLNQAIETGIVTTITTLPLGIGAGINAQNDVSNIKKEALFEAGNEPELYKEKLKTIFDSGGLTEQQYNQKVSTVNTMAGIVASVNKATKTDGKPLSYEEKAALAAQEFRIAHNNKLKEQGVIAAQEAVIDADNKEAAAIQAEILKPAVIMPNEINRPEITTIAPDETIVPATQQSTTSVILPQSNTQPNIISTNYKAEAENAIQEKSNVPLSEIDLNGKSNTNQNFIPEGTSAQSGLNREAATNNIEPNTSRRVEAALQWLESLTGNDSKAQRNAEEELLRQSDDSKTKAHELLENQDRGGGEIRTSSGNGEDVGSQIEAERTRTSQESQRTGQLGEQSGVVDTQRPFETPLQSNIVDKAQGDKPSQLSDNEREMVIKLGMLSDVSDDGEKASLARSVQTLLTESLPNEEKTGEIINILSENLKPENRAIFIEKAAAGVLRNEGVRGKSGLPQVEQDNQSKKPAQESKPKEKVSNLKKLADAVESKGANKAMADWLRDKKLKKGGLRSQVIPTFGLPEAIVNAAIERIAKEIESGSKVGNAIARAMKWIDVQVGGKKWDKGAFAKHVSDVHTIKINGKDEVVQRDDSQETAAVINGFYSPLEQRIIDVKEDNLPANKWIERLNTDEAKWTGVRDFLQSKGNEKVTKQELKNFIQNNRIEVVEVVKSNGLEWSQEAANAFEKVGIDFTTADAEEGEQTNPYFYSVKTGDEISPENMNKKQKAVYDKFIKENTKYGQYVVPGESSNYREVLVTLPNKSKPKTLVESLQKEKDQYSSSHWDEKNILVHLRMNNRVDAEGNKVLFVEEIQSDWGQSGKKQGFALPQAEKDVLEKEYQQNRQRRIDIISEIQDAFNNEEFKEWKALNEEDSALTKRANELSDLIYAQGQPLAPFVVDTNSWVKLGLKKAIQEAVNDGASRVAWITGEQSNERYDLSKHIDEVAYRKNSDGTYNIAANRGGENIWNKDNATLSEIENTLGKDMAEKVANGVGEDFTFQGKETKSIEGVNLKVGGKGMKGFYGEPSEGKEGIVGSVAKALVRELTGTEGKIVKTNIEIHPGNWIDFNVEKGDFEKTDQLPEFSTQHSIEITPALKASVEQGMPLFGEAKPPSKLRALADKIEQGGLLPSWAKANLPEGTQGAGFNLDKAVADAIRFIDDAINKGMDVAQAIEEGFDKIRQHYKDNNAKFKDEADFKNNFTEYVKDGLGITGGSMSSITQAATEQARVEFGINEPYQRTQKSDIELEKEANDVIKNGYNIENLLSAVEKGKAPSDIETTILKVYIAGVEASIEKNPTDEKLGELQRFYKAMDSIGSEQGRAFRARQGLRVREDSLADFFVRDQDVNEGVPLTDDQKAQVVKEHEVIVAAKKAYEEKIAKLEAENAKLKAAKAINKTKAETVVNKKKTHEDFVKERESIVSSIKDKLKKARTGESGLTAVPVPYAAELFAIAPDVVRLAKSLVEEGFTKLADVVSNLHATLKEDLPDITEKDVHDILAGEYNEKRKTRNELQKQIYDLRTEAKLINRLEQLENGVEPKKEEDKRKQKKEIEDLKKKIKEHDLTKLAAAKSRIKKEIEKVQGLIDAGKYENDKKEPLKLDAEGVKLKDALIKLRQERNLRLMKQQYANRTAREKLKDNILEVMNVPRTLMSSLDYSAPLRQGVVASAAHPILAAKAGMEMFKQSFSQKRFDRWFFDLRESPRYKLMEQSGLYVADPHDPRLSVKEEAFMNNLAEKIPFIGKLIKGSERAYVGYLNKMRVDLFNQTADVFEAEGRTFENSEALFKGLATFINNATGRGNLGKVEAAAPVLNSVFFSPRLIASRMNLLGDFLTYGNINKYPKEIKKMMYGDMFKFLGVGAAVLSLLKLAWGCDDAQNNDCFQVELDARSSDFGKLKYNNTRWDVWGGLQQYIRILTQMIAGQSKSINSGNIQDLSGEGMFGKTRGDVALSFFRGKLAPIPSMAADVLSGRTTTGEEVTLKDEAIQHLFPLLISDMKDAVKDNGVKAVFTVGIPSAFGVGVQTYLPRGYENVDVKKDPVYKFLYDRKIKLPEPSLKDIPEKEAKDYIKQKEAYFKQEWKQAMDYGVMLNEKGNPTTDERAGVELKKIENLTYDELAALMKSISTKSTRAAKKDLGIETND